MHLFKGQSRKGYGNVWNIIGDGQQLDEHKPTIIPLDLVTEPQKKNNHHLVANCHSSTQQMQVLHWAYHSVFPYSSFFLGGLISIGVWSSNFQDVPADLQISTNTEADLGWLSSHHHSLDCPRQPPIHRPRLRQMRHLWPESVALS